MEADLVILGGKVITMEAARPEAEAVAVASDRIVAVDDVGSIRSLAGPRTRTIDLRGQLLLPGFYDAHQHQINFGLYMEQIDARPTRVGSIQELKLLVRQRVESSPAGQWILGYGYDEDHLAEHRHPTRFDLDEVAPQHPVSLTRACGHVAVANSAALRLAGIGVETLDPPGGHIEHDRTTGEPTGVLFDAAINPVRRARPAYSRAQLRQSILSAGLANLRLGITSVWEPGLDPEQVDAYQELNDRGELPLRVTIAQNRWSRTGSWLDLRPPFLSESLSLTAVKLFADGTLTSRTAALSEPYSDDSTGSGTLRWTADELSVLIDEAHRGGWQVAVHAIGDLAISGVIDAMETALVATPRDNHRHRIEHSGVLSPLQRNRLVRLGIVPVPQPSFLFFKGDCYLKRLGPARARWLYPARSLLQAGIPLPASSDHPYVPDHNPLLGIQAAVTRRTQDGQVVAADERVSVIEALRMYTLGSAYACREEAIKGSIAPGKLADMVVLAEDVTRIPTADLAEVPVTLTIVGGEVRWSLN